MEQLKLYLKESYNELMHKVTWPSWTSLQRTSIAVIIASIILSLIIFLMDLASKGILDQIYPS